VIGVIGMTWLIRWTGKARRSISPACEAGLGRAQDDPPALPLRNQVLISALTIGAATVPP